MSLYFYSTALNEAFWHITIYTYVIPIRHLPYITFQASATAQSESMETEEKEAEKEAEPKVWKQLSSEQSWLRFKRWRYQSVTENYHGFFRPITTFI